METKNLIIKNIPLNDKLELEKYSKKAGLSLSTFIQLVLKNYLNKPGDLCIEVNNKGIETKNLIIKNIPLDNKEKMDIAAKKTGLSLSKFIKLVIRNYLENPYDLIIEVTGKGKNNDWNFQEKRR